MLTLVPKSQSASGKSMLAMAIGTARRPVISFLDWQRLIIPPSCEVAPIGTFIKYVYKICIF